MGRHTLLRLAFVAWALGLSSAWACPIGTVPSASLPAVTLMTALVADNCVGDVTADKDALTQAVLKEDEPAGAGGKNASADALARSAQTSIERLRAYANGQHAAASGELAVQWRAVAGELAAAFQRSRAMPMGSAAELAVASDKVIIDSWRRYRSNPQSPMRLGDTVVDPVCRSGVKPCNPADQFESRVRMWRVVTLAAAVSSRMQLLANEERIRAYDILLRRWDAYRSEALHQTWWELAWNSARMNSDREICPRDDKDQRVGLCKVPQSQMILLHPDVGLRMTRNANNSSELKPYLVLEVIGYSSFTWARDENDATARPEDIATLGRQLGYSLAVAYGFDGDRNRWAVGPMLHWNRYNVAVTRSTSGRWALTVNTTLSDAFFTKREAAATKLQKLGLRPGRD